MLDTAVPSLAPTTDPAWLLVEEGFTLVREHELESQFAIANGYLGSRGSLAKAALFLLQRLTSPASSTRSRGSVPHLVEIHDWCHLSVSICGQTAPARCGADSRAPPHTRHAASHSVALLAPRG